MEERLLRLREVKKITGMGRSTIYRRMQERDFPRPLKIGPAAVRWRKSEIMDWVESRPKAMGDHEQSNGV